MKQPIEKQRSSGFTLVELMVVLAIAAIISSITFGAFRSISQGNKRSSCQANLSQLYQSCRLYAQDYNGKFPYLNPPVDASNYAATVRNNPPLTDPNRTPAGGIGLWSLYTYRKTGDVNCNYPQNSVDLPLPEGELAATAATGYVKNVRIFHCPSDDFTRTIGYHADPADSTSVCTTTPVESGQLTFTPMPPTRRLNPAYLSYQTADDVQRDPSVAPDYSRPVNTYSSFRGEKVQKQLTYFVGSGAVSTRVPERPSDDNTIITWCRFHRINKAVDSSPGDIATQANSRSYDNVLFYDGTVQNLPTRQDKRTTAACDSSTSATDCVTGWERVPKRAQ